MLLESDLTITILKERLLHTLWSSDILPLIIFSFLLGGIVKGIIGTGLPTIALALLTATIGLKQGMALILFPSILTNIDQGFRGGYFKDVVRRNWSFYLATFFTVWVGAAFIPRVNVTLLSGLLGVILLLYAAMGLSKVNILTPTPQSERYLSPILGGVNGLLTGLTGSSVIPGVLYLQSLGFPKDMLIQTMGLLFFISTTTLAFALQKNQLLTRELLLLSALAFIPSYIGMYGGRLIRMKISETMFKKLFFAFMLLLGCYILIKSFIFNGYSHS